ncbi:phosphatidate cytidylyltransferase 2-like [Oscarella lobularis]|uniref:phosphatidate cytidylyltransferase 2-like n=1 Tax=Oscarella lobularis TaxID=121494 RepID=UPI003313CC73
MPESVDKSTTRIRKADSSGSESAAKSEMKTTSDEGSLANVNFLKRLGPRWRNWWIRGIFSLVLLGTFALIIYMGPIAMWILVSLIQFKSYHEIIKIGHSQYKKHHLPLFRTLQWYFLAVSNYFIHVETLQYNFEGLFAPEETMTILLRHHRLISFMLYILGFVFFVLTLKKDYYAVQFTQFGWTHVTLLILVSSSYLIIQNIFSGMIWFLAPVLMVICNDIMAYVFGFFFGRTSLIKLSPKKTWEGFIGAAFSTLIFAFVLGYFLSPYKYMICPVQYIAKTNSLSTDCQIPSLFLWTEYVVPSPIRSLTGVSVVHMYPFQIHALVLGLFSSIIAPFGGFFASGFKRAFNIKDFGDMIPGHGGIMDRFDCQLVMAIFAYVWVYSFAQIVTPARLLKQIYALGNEQQVEIFQAMKEALTQRELL